jgi:hypothetical protein
MLGGDKDIASLILQGRLPSFLEKGQSLPESLILCIHHFRRVTHPRSGEEIGHVLHSTDKDQKGGPRVLKSGRILSHLDTWVFKHG